MKNLSSIVKIVLVLVILTGTFLAGYFTVKNEERLWKENFHAAIDSVVKEVRNDQALYHKEVITLTKSEMKEYYAEQWKQWVKDYKLRDPQQVTSVNATTTNNINTILRDSTLYHQKYDTIRCKKLEGQFNSFYLNLLIKPNDSVTGHIRHHLSLQIALSKQKRTGLINKATLRPWKRPLITTAIPSDTNTIITNLQTIIIK